MDGLTVLDLGAENGASSAPPALQEFFRGARQFFPGPPNFSPSMLCGSIFLQHFPQNDDTPQSTCACPEGFRGCKYMCWQRPPPRALQGLGRGHAHISAYAQCRYYDYIKMPWHAHTADRDVCAWPHVYIINVCLCMPVLAPAGWGPLAETAESAEAFGPAADA